MDEDFLNADDYNIYDDIEPDIIMKNDVDIGNLINVSYESIIFPNKVLPPCFYTYPNTQCVLG